MTSKQRSLTLVRHAKARNGGDEGDVSRPLSFRGTEQISEGCAAIGAQLIRPSVVLCSPARRAVETWQGIAAALPHWQSEQILEQRLYLAHWTAILGALGELPDEIESVMIVGHNPGISDLAGELLGESVGMRTFGLVSLQLQASEWRSFADFKVIDRLLWRIRGM